ncbi:MAG: transposase [Acidobacteriota bacterium]|nr:transposase [Acidobacteriota bacterium]
MPLVKHGLIWSEGTPSGSLRKAWTPAWRKRAPSCDLGGPLPSMAPRMGAEMAERMERSAKELAKAVSAGAERPRRRPRVDALTRMKGVDVQAALLAAAELGGFPCFRSGRRVSRWIGCTSSEGSAGESRRQGKITKEGGSRPRRALVEGVSTTSRRTAHRRCLRPGHEASPTAEGIALEADAQLRRRCDAPRKAGKHADVAKVAAVSEMARVASLRLRQPSPLPPASPQS